MADKYRFKRIKEEIYRISFATDENINFTRHNLSVATIFSTFPFIWPLFEETSMKRTSKVQYSRETETEGEIEGEISFLRVLTWPDIHLVADC